MVPITNNRPVFEISADHVDYSMCVGLIQGPDILAHLSSRVLYELHATNQEVFLFQKINLYYIISHLEVEGWKISLTT